MSEHSRWDGKHRLVCHDCYEEWLDACQDMATDELLDKSIEEDEE